MCGRGLVGLVAAIAMALGAPAAAQATVKTVNFDDLSVGTTVDTQYAASAGVTFPGQTDFGFKPVVRSAPAQATSGTQVADFNTCVGGTDACGEFRPALTRGRLSTTATEVTVNIGYLDTGNTGQAPVQLRAYDAGGTLLDTDDATVDERGPFKTMTVEGANIAYFDLYADSAYQLAMDDLSITYPDAPPAPDFSLSSGPGVAEVLEGTSTPVGLDLTRLNGSTGDVTFSVTGLPPGMTASFAPNPVGGTDTHTVLTLTAPSGASTTDYATATVTATPTGGAAVGPAARSITFSTRIKQNCEHQVAFAYVDARTDGCFHKFGEGLHQHEITNQVVRLDGLILTPLDGDRTLVIDDDKKTIKSPNSTWAVAIPATPNLQIYAGLIDWSFGGGSGDHQVTGIGVGAGQILSIAGLPVTGLTASFTQDAKTKVTPTFKLDFWPFNYLGAITTSATLSTSNDAGANFAGFDLKVSKVEALALTLTDVNLHYQDGGTWNGSVKATLNFAKKLTVGAGFGVKNGNFDSLSASVSNINTPIGAGIYLQSLGFGVNRTPVLAISGSIGLSGGPSVAGKTAVSVGGTLKATLGDPFVIEVNGNAKLAGKWSIGQAFLKYSSFGLFEFGGGVDWSFGPLGLKGGVNGWVAGLSAFDVEGSIEGCLHVDYLPDPCAGAKALVSSIGLAGCVQVYGYGVGAAATWGGDFDAFTGCDLSPWRPQKPTASGAQAGRALSSVKVPPGLPLAAWQVKGRGGHGPGVTLTAPGGRKITVTKNNPYYKRDGVLAALLEDGTTLVVVRKPAAGTWRLRSDGSVPVAGVRYARGLPKPKVHATVTRRGSKRVLSWRLTRIAGQKVAFVESGKDVRRVIKTTRAARGKVVFTPARGSAGTRKIIALVQQRGRPRATLTVARFRAASAVTPARPKGLKLTRKGTTVTVAWRAPRAGFRHAVHVTLADGTQQVRVVAAKGHATTLTGVAATAAVSVTVRGLTPGNALGPVARATLKANKKTS